MTNSPGLSAAASPRICGGKEAQVCINCILDKPGGAGLSIYKPWAAAGALTLSLKTAAPER